MATDKTIPISCRISVENADKLRVLLEKHGITLRNLVENLIDGVNTFEVGVNTFEVGVNTKKESVNTKMISKSVNTNEEKCKHLVNTGVNTTLESVNTELEKTIKDIKSMLSFMNISYEDFMKLVDDGLTDLSLTVENGKLKTNNVDLKLDEFYEVCHEVGADPQKMINETINRMRKGK